MTIDWWLHYPDRGGENLFYPGPYTESGIHVTARWQGQRGMFQIGMPLDQDWGRVAGRENVGLVKKDGVPRLSRQGRRVRADLTRRGKVLYRIETEVLDSPAHPMVWHRETGFGAFLYRYRLDPDWRRGPLGPDPVELWLRVLGGKRGVYPQEMIEGAPRQCDLDRTTFAMVEPSPLDPFAEFPLHAIVAVSYRETGLYPQADRLHREAKTDTRIERLQLIDPKRFEPWAFYMYDRPITAGRAWAPVGWPQERTAMKLEPDELERYRQRDALALELRDLVAGRSARRRRAARANAAARARSRAGAAVAHPRARRRRPATSRPQPFHELWLLARCLREGREAWYALSHLVGPDGDVVFGRETFGYPSRMASIEWSRDGESFAIAASRLGRRVVELARRRQRRRLLEEDTRLAVEIVGLRLHPPYRAMTENGFVEPGPRADLVAQPWTFELRSSDSLASLAASSSSYRPTPDREGSASPIPGTSSRAPR